MSLAAEIRAEMGRKNIRPAGLARATGMSKEKISRIVTREVQDIALEDLEKISEVLETPTWELMRRAEENKEGATSSTSGAPGNNKKAGHFND
jgi:DNA-binding Xre family transcriptional regulator